MCSGEDNELSLKYPTHTFSFAKTYVAAIYIWGSQDHNIGL